MHQSRRITWLVFLVGVVAVVEVLAWVSWRLVSLEREQQQSREDAARQEAIGRALWRMDSIVIPLLAVESARPYWEYQPFYPAGRRADQMWLPLAEGETLVASPLLGEPVDLVRLHFERDGSGRLTSPQAPVGQGREAAVAAGVPEVLLARADIDLYELDRLDGDTRGQAERSASVDGETATRAALDDGAFDRAANEAAWPDEAGVAGLESIDLASREREQGLGQWFDPQAQGRDQGVRRVTSSPGVIGESQSQPRSEPPEFGEQDAGALLADQREVGGDAPNPGTPVESPAAQSERADARQDYLARQYATENAQTYNDPSRSGRSRSLERNVYQNIATPEAAASPESEDATSLIQGAAAQGDERNRRESPAGTTPDRSQEQAASERVTGDGAGAQPASAAARPAQDGTLDAMRDGVRRAEGPAPAAPDPATANSLLALRETIEATPLQPGFLDAPIEEAIGGTPHQPASALKSAIAGPLSPQWRGPGVAGGEGALVLIRHVTVGDQTREQGVWIDWPALRRDLESSVADLFPLAQVQPVASTPTRAGAGDAQRLATLPVVLIPGPLAAGILPPTTGFWTPTRWTLLVGWIAVAAAVVAIGVVLRKAIDLGERRGRFVSAVTHELRTPLTTFRLYSQMLAGDTLTDEGKRRRYAQTLDRESQRLSGIVESVLEYARLGRRASGASSRQRLDLSALLERVRPALGGRAERAGMDLAWPDAAPSAVVMGDPDKIERILLNLVDNACKYAGESSDRRLVLDVTPSDGTITLGVRDFGPGVPPAERRRIFNAFHRAKHHDASASPGLGLGLALSRGLAREMGGDLRLVEHEGPGARFELVLILRGSPSEPTAGAGG